jgi:CRP-like cAMP-binding protein
MGFAKNKSIAFPLILFCISFVVIISGIFKIPQNDPGSEYTMDKIFYYTISIVLWLTGAFLINKLISKLFWGKLFKITAGSRTIGMLEDILSAAFYVIAAGIIIISCFNQPFNVSWGVLLLLLFILVAFIRPKFVKVFNNAFLSSVHPFKVGDWIKLQHKTGTNSIIGEIIDYDKLTIRLKSENDTLIMFPNNLLEEFIIENYQGLKEETKFNVDIDLHSNIPVDRVKRILLAGTKQALSETNITNGSLPQILVNNISNESIKYKIDFWIKPWETFSPEKVKDVVFTTVVNHLRIAGIGFGLTDEGFNILKNIILFNSLNDSEIDKLFKSAKKSFYTAGTAIIKQCDEGNSMYVLAEGLLNVYIKTGESVTEGIKVGTISPGQFFGEMSLFTGENRSATVISETDSIVYEITKESLKGILENNPLLISEFGKIIAERQSANTLKLEESRNKKDSFIEKIISKIKSVFELN